MATADQLAAVAERVLPDGRLLGARRLTGGVSAIVHALDVAGADGQRREVVLRRYPEVPFKQARDGVAEMEHGLLAVLFAAGLPVPEPLLLDTSGQLFEEPFLVMAFAEGAADVPADDGVIDAMADALVRLHSLATDSLPPLPARTDPLPELFDYLPDTAEWAALRRRLRQRTNTAFRETPVLLHGDFWPGNLLWRDGRLAAILDWEDAALGDPVADVAGARIELVWKHGPDAAERFTRAYAQRRPLDPERLALWDVFVAAGGSHFMHEWRLEPDREAELRRRATGFIRDAAKRLR